MQTIYKLINEANIYYTTSIFDIYKLCINMN